MILSKTFLSKEMNHSAEDDTSSGTTGSFASFEKNKGTVLISKHCIAAKKIIEYNNALKCNIEDLLIHLLNPKDVLHVFKKYSKNILTDSNIEKIECTIHTEGNIKGTIEFLDMISKCDKWFPVLLKCLKDKHLKQAFLVKHLKKIEGDVYKLVYKSSKKQKSSKDTISTCSDSTSTSLDLFGESRLIIKSSNRSSHQEKTSTQINSHVTNDVCLCQLDVVLKEIKSALNPTTPSDFFYICSRLNIIFDILKNYRNNLKILEIILRLDLPDVLIHFTTIRISDQSTVGLTTKKMAMEMFAYLVSANNMLNMKLITQDFLGVFKNEFGALNLLFSTHIVNDEETKNLLMSIKRDLVLILLAYAKNESFKEMLLTEIWTQIFNELLDDEDRFVVDMSIFFKAYISENEKFTEILKEKNLSPSQALTNILNHLRIYSEYNIPCSKSKIEANAYIEGLARLALMEDTSKGMKKYQLLEQVHTIVQRLDDQMIYKSYFSLLTNIGIFHPEEEQPEELKDAVSEISPSDYAFIPDTDLTDVLKHNVEMPCFVRNPSLFSAYSEYSSGSLYSLHFGEWNPSKSIYSNLFLGDILVNQESNSTFEQEKEFSRDEVELKEQVGLGNFATVWKGLIEQTREVAVKIMKQEHSSVEIFLNEIKILKKLDHPKIIQLLAVINVKPFWIIMEYMAQGNLKTFLKADMGKKVKTDKMMNINKQITKGMMYLQDMRVVHRDLRAENILVDQNLDVKISDFGLACVLDSDNIIYNGPLSLKFPVKWTAPEGASERRFSFYSDVWSFGVVMYEVITFGEEPYSGLSNETAFQMIQKGEFLKTPTDVPLEVPDFYFDKMLTCWNQVPEKRPSFSHLYMYFESFIFKQRKKDKTTTTELDYDSIN